MSDGKPLRVALTATAIGGFLLLSASHAWAQAQLIVQPDVVQPGGTVTVSGFRGFASGKPLEIHLDDVAGPVLATSAVTGGAFGPAQVTIPANTSVGSHVLVITQPLDSTNAGVRGLPARGALQVTGPGGLPAGGVDLLRPVGGQPTDLAVKAAPRASAGSLVLIALCVAAVATLVAVMGGRRVGKRPASAPAEVAAP